MASWVPRWSACCTGGKGAALVAADLAQPAERQDAAERVGALMAPPSPAVNWMPRIPCCPSTFTVLK